MRRFTLAALATVAFAVSGCVEGTQTFTLNPDGSGKVRIDVAMSPPAEFIGGPKAQEPPTLEGARLQSLKTLLKGAQGIAAWKDVAASFAPDGRFKFAGTAYFDKLDRLDFPNTGPFLGSPFGLVSGAEKGGQLVLAKKPPRGPGPPTAEPPPLFGGPGRQSAEQLAKKSDAELDEYILTDRVQYQLVRPMMVAAFSRGKMTATYLLPGAATEVTGFKAEGTKVVWSMDGDKVITGMDAFLGRPDADLRGVYRKAGAFEAALVTALGSTPDDRCKAVVARPGPAQFDYAAEVKAARAAYPELRQSLKLPADYWLPDGNPPPPMKGFGPRP
ncbi:MAG TPA: hypothetical protein VD866_00490 [Urbifossiella sp.]|nr:hypothetical protein [Urbifossiella sp.]